MRRLVYLVLITLILSLLKNTQANARPEYAVRLNVNRCTACHVSPVGGGPRNLNGKLFGSRLRSKPAPYSQQELVSAEALFNYYDPKGQSAGGLGVMAVNIAGNIPIATEDEDETRLLIEHNLGGFPGGTGGPRQTFVRKHFFADTESSWSPQYVLLGRL